MTDQFQERAEADNSEQQQGGEPQAGAEPPYDPLADISPDILDRVVTVAFGAGKLASRSFRNRTGTYGDLLRDRLTKFVHGEKDGLCLTQGKLVGAHRQSKDVIQNDLMMFDCDTGASLLDVYNKLEASGYYALMWTTYSHMKPSTDVTETEIIRFRKKAGLPDDELDISVCRKYLREVKKVEEWLLDTITRVEREHKEGGVTFVVHHDPMPRCRIQMLLDKPFEFAKRGGTQAEAIQEWKERYAGMSEQLGIAHDTKCVDPARLMYTPRIPEGAVGEFYIIPGRMVDIDAVPRVGRDGGDDEAAPFVAMGGKTPGIMKFVAEHGNDYRIADHFGTMFPDDVRPGGGGDKINFRCPNEDGHSVISSEDSGFMLVNGDGITGFRALCQHTTCGHESNNDRIWFLDRLCQHYGVTVEDLLLNCPEYQARQEEEQQKADDKAEKQTTLQAAVRARIDALTPESKEREAAGRVDLIKDVVRAWTSNADRLLRADEIAAKLGLKGLKRAIAKEVKSAGAEHDAQGRKSDDADARGAEAYPVPKNGAGCTDIWAHWPASDRHRMLDERVKAVNDPDPELYARDEGGCVRLVFDDTGMKGAYLSPITDRDQWAYVIGKFVKFKRRATKTTPETEIDVPDWAITRMKGGGGANVLPRISRIIRAPVFNRDCVPMYTSGYDPALQVYVDLRDDFAQLGEPVTQENVGWAVWQLKEALRDFPFSDAYTDAEAQPVRHEFVNAAGQRVAVTDTDGHPMPNPDRGQASLAHTLAMIIQPFVRAMICTKSGQLAPCPMYAITAPMPGSGKDTVVNVAGYIAEGRPFSKQALPSNEDEFVKVMCANARAGDDVIWFNNVSPKTTVYSPCLASASTSCTFKGRILSKSEYVDVDFHGMIITDGNNLKSAAELIRRQVPIKLDHGVDDPASDDDLPDTHWKHKDLDDWLLANRWDLVMAVHVLVMWWHQQGQPPYVGPRIKSYRRWCEVMGGILQAAGIGGFLASINDYRAAANEEHTDTGALVAALAGVHEAGRPVMVGAQGSVRGMTATEIVDHLRGMALDYLLDAAEVDSRDDATRAAGKFGRYLAANLKDRTFTLADGVRVKAIRGHTERGKVYWLVPVAA